MPYIRGRYYMNPVVGDALEAAREAEAALQALEHAAKVARGDTGEDDDDGEMSSANSAGGSANAAASHAAAGPIHRVEIEAAELVPAHAGRAQRGFVARIHRRPGIAANSALHGGAPASPVSIAPAPETHVFANHNDLTKFLGDQFTNDCK
jgi:hypothetical protein